MSSHTKQFISILSILLVFSLLSCNDDPVESTNGILVVSVTDNDAEETSVPDVEIMITPGNQIMLTDEHGVCEFELDPGEYIVIADVCCVGPANIHYEESVTVVKNQTTEITLFACLRCL